MSGASSSPGNPFSSFHGLDPWKHVSLWSLPTTTPAFSNPRTYRSCYTHVYAVAVSTSFLLAPFPPSVRYIFTYQCHHLEPSLRATGPDLSGDLIDRLNATLSHEDSRVAEPVPAEGLARRLVNVHSSARFFVLLWQLLRYLSRMGWISCPTLPIRVRELRPFHPVAPDTDNQ